MRCALLLSLCAVIGGARAAGVLVVAPHPDDEVLCCSGVLHRAVARGHAVRVALLTNGEFYGSGRERGIVRQGESVAALALLGVPEDSVAFLGYPDAYLRKIVERRTSEPLVTKHGISETYGERGLGGADYHFVRTGQHASYTFDSVVGDVASMLLEFRPDHVVVSGTSADSHGDHKSADVIVREALAAALKADPRFRVALHKAMVWNTDITWPNFYDPSERVRLPNTPEFEGHAVERLDVPSQMLSAVPKENLKYRAIESYASQSGATCSILLRFIHRDELFFATSFPAGTEVPIVDAGSDSLACAGDTVVLDGSNSTGLSHLAWKQIAGPSVELQYPESPRPRFVVPLADSEEAVFEFELSGGSDTFEGLPDGVVVRVRPSGVEYGGNVAPLAVVTASSSVSRSHGAINDGVVDGIQRTAPTTVGDAVREWVSREAKGAWIELNWTAPRVVGRIDIHDSVGCGSNVVKGALYLEGVGGQRLLVPVGPLDNSGLAYTVVVEPLALKSLRFVVEQTNKGLRQVGLAEIKVFEARKSASHAGVEPQRELDREGAGSPGDEWKLTHSKTYASEVEEEQRFQVFLDNLAYYATMNAVPGQTAVFGPNKFSDLNSTEFASRFLMSPGARRPEASVASTRRNNLAAGYPGVGHYPANFMTPWVSPARSQGGCGACWAFTTTAVLEGAYMKAHHGVYLKLSVQNLIDCSTLGGSFDGCRGYYPSDMIKELAEAGKSGGGVVRETDYVYEGKAGECLHPLDTPGDVVVKNYISNRFEEHQGSPIYDMVMNYGSLAVGMNSADLRGYVKGIVMNSFSCDQAPDHAVTLVGWGEENNVKYWILKNSLPAVGVEVA
eukprot:m51a1_g10843 putative cathepsin f precursor (846) ;mRNA; f:27667-31774